MTLSPRHEKFAQLVASGVPAGRAYEQCGYSPKGDMADALASRLKGNEKVSARIAELEAQNANVVEMSREALVKFHVDVLTAKPEDAAFDSPLCELKMSKSGPYAAFPDKQKSADAIAKLCGFNAPEKVDVSGDALAALFAEIRARKT